MSEQRPGPAPTLYQAPDAQQRARMPLIDLIASGALDEEYGEVARRRPPRDPAARKPRPGLVGAAAVLFFAVLVTLSFQQTRDNESVVDASRATLEDGIRSGRQDVSAAQDRIVALRDADNAAESLLDLLDQTARESEGRLRVLRSTTGFSSGSGPGVRLVVGDNPDGVAAHRVYDEDLALLVNGLWQAGAQAIAINGQRLTSVSAIRNSGSTVRVNKVNLSPPYTLEVLGDEDTLQADLLDTTTGLQFQARVDELGFTFTMQNEDRLVLPAAPTRLTDLRSAVSAPSADQAPRAEEEDP